jgi:hypothetical protein
LRSIQILGCDEGSVFMATNEQNQVPPRKAGGPDHGNKLAEIQDEKYSVTKV